MHDTHSDVRRRRGMSWARRGRRTVPTNRATPPTRQSQQTSQYPPANRNQNLYEQRETTPYLVQNRLTSNSHAAASSNAGSAHTPVRLPSGLKANSPPAIAIKYDGIATGCLNVYVLAFPSIGTSSSCAGETLWAEHKIGSVEVTAAS